MLSADGYKRVFKKSYRSVDSYFTVLAHSHSAAETKLGLAIAKKVIRKAVARNRLKRLVRESFRHNKIQLEGFDLVVMARSKALTASNSQLAESLIKHWQGVIDHRRA